MKLPGLQTAALATGGFVVPPILESYLTPYLPAALTTSQGGRYVTKLGTVFGLSWATKALLGSSAAYKVGIGGMIYLAGEVLRDFLPSIAATPQPAAAYYPRLAAQPLLGDYGRTASMTATTPSRLQPQSRY